MDGQSLTRKKITSLKRSYNILKKMIQAIFAGLGKQFHNPDSVFIN